MRSIAALLVTAVCVFALAACGGGGDSKSSSKDSGGGESTKTASGGGEGKTAFGEKCAGCHTLADAAAEGAVGPNLDDLKPDEATVRTTIEKGKGAMPSGIAKGDEADAIAKYVAENAGK